MKVSITIIGTGLSGEDISAKGMRAIERAHILVGGKRQLSFFSSFTCEKVEVTADISKSIKAWKKKFSGKKVAVLASGDPNFFGIASLFYATFNKEHISVIPNITAFQAAFARIKEPWDHADFISIHGRDIQALQKVIRKKGMFVIYCDGNNTPSKAARYLVEQDNAAGECKTWVFDALGTEKEKVLCCPLENVIKVTTSTLSMMIIKKEHAKQKAYPGIPDSDFVHQKGMITKRDVRVLTLSRLNLHESRVLWDIGAGSGSVSIEAATLFPDLNIYAVEQRNDRFRILKQNIRKFNVENIVPVHGSAPDALMNLPRPDAAFIGGSGGELERILTCVKKRINDQGIIVANCVTLVNLALLKKILEKWNWQYNITAVRLEHLEAGITPGIFRPETPVFIVIGKKIEKRKK